MIIGERVVRPPSVPQGAGIILRNSIEAGTVGGAQLFPNPPPVVRKATRVAMPIAEQNYLRGYFQHRPAAEIILVTRWPSKWRLRPARRPVHVHSPDASGDRYFARDEPPDFCGVTVGIELFSFRRAVIHFDVAPKVREQIRTPTG